MLNIRLVRARSRGPNNALYFFAESNALSWALMACWRLGFSSSAKERDKNLFHTVKGRVSETCSYNPIRSMLALWPCKREAKSAIDEKR